MSYSSSSTFRRFKVFSTKKVTMQVSDKGEVQPKKYWLVESDAKSALTIRPIDESTWLPTGQPHSVSVRELQRRYNPEPGIYEKYVQPSLESYDSDTLLLGPPEDQGKEPPAPVNEEQVIQNFQNGMTLLEKGELDQAKIVFTSIVYSDEPFEEKHKHMFNDFAIQLRKNNLNSESIAFYTRAIELSWDNEDENLHINLARVLYAEKQYSGCVQHLFDALRIAPGHKVARSFLIWLEQQKVIPKQYALQVRGSLAQQAPENVVEQATDTMDAESEADDMDDTDENDSQSADAAPQER